MPNSRSLPQRWTDRSAWKWRFSKRLGTLDKHRRKLLKGNYIIILTVGSLRCSTITIPNQSSSNSARETLGWMRMHWWGTIHTFSCLLGRCTTACVTPSTSLPVRFDWYWITFTLTTVCFCFVKLLVVINKNNKINILSAKSIVWICEAYFQVWSSYWFVWFFVLVHLDCNFIFKKLRRNILKGRRQCRLNKNVKKFKEEASYRDLWQWKWVLQLMRIFSTCQALLLC